MKRSYVERWIAGWSLMARAAFMLGLALCPAALLGDIADGMDDRDFFSNPMLIFVILVITAYTCTVAPIIFYWLAHKIGFPLDVEDSSHDAVDQTD